MNSACADVCRRTLENALDDLGDDPKSGGFSAADHIHKQTKIEHT